MKKKIQNKSVSNKSNKINTSKQNKEIRKYNTIIKSNKNNKGNKSNNSNNENPGNIKRENNSTSNTTKMTFYVKNDLLEKLYNFAYWDRYKITEAFNKVLADGLKGKTTKPVKR